MDTWSNMTNIFVEECNRSKLITETTNELEILGDRGHATAVTGRQNSDKRSTQYPREGRRKCVFGDTEQDALPEIVTARREKKQNTVRDNLMKSELDINPEIERSSLVTIR